MARIILFEHKNVCIYSCTIYIVLIAIIFTINIGIGTYVFYYKYMNLEMIKPIKQKNINANGKYKIN